MSDRKATLRPAGRGLLPALLLGALGGAVVGTFGGVPTALAALGGAAAAAIAMGVQHATGLRVVLTEEGVAVRGGGLPALSARWSELRVGFGTAVAPGTRLTQRYAILADPRGRSFAFAERQPGAAGLPLAPVRGLDGDEVPVVDLRDAAILLALVIQRVPRWDYLPPELQAPPPSGLAAPEAASAALGPARSRPGSRVGLLALLGKLGGTFAKLFKTANVAWAAASFAAYGILFTWRGALAIVVGLALHEAGHAWAMLRSGMKVRGSYLVPFLGAVTVTEDAYASRRQQAYVALNGPLWGAASAALATGLYLWTGRPFFASVAAWWALLNLLNLLPVVPLDGGRVLQAFAFSFSSTLGLALCVVGLAGAVAVGAWLGYGLVWVVGVLGAMELISEASARAGGGALRLLPEPERFGLAHFRHLRALAGPPLGSPGESLFLRNLERVRQAARAAPLRPRELLAWGLAYAGLAAFLLALVHFLGTVPGGSGPGQLLG